MYQTTLLDKCRNSVQLTPSEINCIVELIAGRCKQETKDKLKTSLEDIRGISKTGHLANIRFLCINESFINSTVLLTKAYKGLEKDLRQLLGA